MFARFRRLLSQLSWLVRSRGLRGDLGALRSECEKLRVELAQLSHHVSALEWLAQAARWRPGDLRFFEHRCRSQNGEDGILREIFSRIGTTNRYFVEFGVGDGSECNSAALALDQQWNGLQLEADPREFEQLAARYAPFPGIRCAGARVTPENIESVLAQHEVPPEPDLLSIDIDGQDYWVWSELVNWRPRVVVVEYNASYRPPVKWVMSRDPEHVWDATSYFGASLAALEALGRAKAYQLVGTESCGVNAFFVRSDLCGDRFIAGSAGYFYSPPRYGAPPHYGHPPGIGPALES